MKRDLCYTHHCREFDKLASHDRHLAAEWRTVPPEECEICRKEEGDGLDSKMLEVRRTSVFD